MQAKWGTLLSCSLSCFVVWLDFAIVNTALPAIEVDLSASIIQLQWVVNAFILAITVLIVIFGRLSDLIGRRIMNILGVSCFGLASLLAGTSQSPEWLIFARFLQGVASAAIIPTALALISHAFPGKEKGKAIGIWAGINGFGMAVGPAVGGFFVSTVGWRWIFYVNIPFAIAGALASALFAKESRSESAGQIDIKGFFSFTVGLSALVFGLMYAPDWGWLSEKTILLFIAAFLFLFWFYRSELRSPFPIIPFPLLLTRDFFCPSMVMVGLNFVFNSVIFLIPLYLIQIRQMAAYQAGFVILSITACIAILSPCMGYLMARVSHKKLMLLGLCFFCMSTVLQAVFGIDTSILFILAALISLGIGWGIARVPATTNAIASAPHYLAGTATGVLWSLQNAGGSLSIAIILTIFRKIFEAGSSPEAFMAGYQLAMWILSAVTIGSIAMVAFCIQSKNTSHH